MSDSVVSSSLLQQQEALLLKNQSLEERHEYLKKQANDILSKVEDLEREEEQVLGDEEIDPELVAVASVNLLNQLEERKSKDVREIEKRVRQMKLNSESKGMSSKERVLRTRLESSERQLEKAKQEIDMLNRTSQSFEMEKKRWNQQHKKDQRMIHQLNKKLGEVQEQKSSVGSKEHESEIVEKFKQVQKEYETTKRLLKKSDQESKQLKQKLSRSQADNARLKQQLKKKEGDQAHQSGEVELEMEHYRKENEQLENEKKQVIQLVQKQTKLIGILRRQKSHLEAAHLLGIGEQEFRKILEFK